MEQDGERKDGVVKNLSTDDLKEEEKPTARQWIMTGAIYYCNLALGIAGAYLAPALLSFAAAYQTDMTTMSVVITIVRYLNLASSLAFGYILGVLNRHAVATYLFFQLAVVITLMPYSGSLPVFSILLTLLNVSFGGWNTAQSIWVIEIWKDKAGPFIQAQHFLYAIGCIVPPVAFAPFLERHKSNITATSNNETILNSTSTTIDHMNGVYMPSLICGIVVAVAAAFLLVTCVIYQEPIRAPVTKKTPAPSELSPFADAETEAAITPKKPSTKFRKIIVITCASLILGGTQSMEMIANNYLPAYAHFSGYKFTQAEGARLFGAFQISFTLARLAGIFVIMKINAKAILIANFALVAAANILFICTSPGGYWLYAYIASVMLGVGFSTTFPTVFAYLQSNLEFTNVIAAILVVGGTALASCSPMLVGLYIENSANIVTWLNLGTDVIGALSFAIIVIAVRGVEGKL